MKVKKLLNHVHYEQMVNILDYNPEEDGYIKVHTGRCKTLLYGCKCEYEQDLLKRKVDTVVNDGGNMNVYLKGE